MHKTLAENIWAFLPRSFCSLYSLSVNVDEIILHPCMHVWIWIGIEPEWMNFILYFSGCPKETPRMSDMDATSNPACCLAGTTNHSPSNFEINLYYRYYAYTYITFVHKYHVSILCKWEELSPISKSSKATWCFQEWVRSWRMFILTTAAVCSVVLMTRCWKTKVLVDILWRYS